MHHWEVHCTMRHDHTYEVMGHSVTAGTTRCADRRVVRNLAVRAVQLCYNVHTSMLLWSGGAVLLTDVCCWARRRPSVSPPPHIMWHDAMYSHANINTYVPCLAKADAGKWH
jgi:hypothetical protein